MAPGSAEHDLGRLDTALGVGCDPLSVDGTAEMRLSWGSATGKP